MLKISKQVDYAFQLVSSLAKLEKGELLNLRAFSKESNISFYFLQRIAKQLREAGIIGAERGVSGGYFLKKTISKISMKKIIESVDGTSNITRCLRDGNKLCVRYNKCQAKYCFNNLNNKINKVFEDSYLDELVFIK